MKVQDYLKLLKRTPEGRLTKACGIYDNWDVLVRADFMQMVELVKAQEKYQHYDTFRDRDKGWAIERFRTPDGVVSFNVDSAVPRSLDYYLVDEAKRKEVNAIFPNYRNCIVMHPHMDESLGWRRKTAEVIGDVLPWLMAAKIPFFVYATRWLPAERADPRRFVVWSGTGK